MEAYTLAIAFSFVVIALVGTTAFDTQVFSDDMLYPKGSDISGAVPNSGNQKIYPNNDAADNEYPFTVYLVNARGSHMCTGTLIDKRWVLTGAQCLDGAVTHVVLGVNDRNGNESTKQQIAVAEEIKHPNYTVGVPDDIGLIRLSARASINSPAIDTIELLKSESFKAKVLANERACRVLGWGWTKYDNGWFASVRLQHQAVRFVNETEALLRGYSVYEGTLSTETLYEDECERGAACSGDGGGPVVCKKGGAWVQVAFSTYYLGYDGCISGVKGNTDVEHYVAWVESVTGRN